MQRSVSFSLALSESERQLLSALAALEERRMGDMLRVCLRDVARRRGLLNDPQSDQRDHRPVEDGEISGTENVPAE